MGLRRSRRRRLSIRRPPREFVWAWAGGSVFVECRVGESADEVVIETALSKEVATIPSIRSPGCRGIGQRPRMAARVGCPGLLDVVESERTLKHSFPLQGEVLQGKDVPAVVHELRVCWDPVVGNGRMPLL